VREYDEIAEWYASNRTLQIGVPEAAALASSIPHASRVLDIGCGNGFPITGTLVSAGHRVVGLDSSREMLDRFRRNLPATPTIQGLVQACAFADGVFDAALAWGVIFHLTRDDQIKAIASVSRVLKTGAPFLFTAGDIDDEAGITKMNGVAFHYYSFSIEEYRRLLRQHGLLLLDVHKDGGQNTYYLARKSPVSGVADGPTDSS